MPIDRLYRDEYGRLLAGRIRVVRDVQLAEDVLQRGLRGSRSAVVRGRAREPVRLDLRHRPAQGDRSGAAARARGQPGLRPRGSRSGPERGAGRGGPSAPPLHVLPSSPRPGGADRADATDALGAIDGGDRARVPRVAGDDGAAARAGQGQDPRRRHPRRGSRGRRARRAPRRRHGRHLPGLQ